MNEIRLAMVLWSVFLCQAFGQWHKPGEFPQGHYYTENELPGLVGKQIPQPSYLIGSFIYLRDNSEGWAIFSSWAQGLTDPNGISTSGIWVGVRFYKNRPGLRLGQVIRPNEKDPLTLIQVVKGPQENITVAITESWSEPEQTGNGN